MKNEKKSISIISSFYNEKENLKRFVDNFEITKLKLEKLGFNVNLILVNDGSTDGSYEIAKEIILLKKFVQLISFEKNYGQQFAIYEALKKNEADFYGALDSDCQQDAELFIQMIDKLKSKNLDFIQMKKKYANYESKIKIFFSKFFYYFFSIITQIDIKPGSSDFYIFRHNVRNMVISSNTSRFFLRGFLHEYIFKKDYLEYIPFKRLRGKSKYNILKQLDFAFTGIYFYRNKLFIIISFLLIIPFLLLILLIFFQDLLIFNLIFDQLIYEFFAILLAAIFLILYCLIILFIIKTENNKFIKPKIKIEN